MTIEKAYAVVKWVPADVQTLRPSWSLERCEEFLSDNESKMTDRLVELGWGVMESYLDMEDDDAPKWTPEEEDGFITDFPSGGYGVAFAGKAYGEFITRDLAETTIRHLGEAANFTPNVWFVDDHGGHTLVENFWSREGEGAGD